MNILEILKENSVLLEAIKISTPQDAYELIKNKKLGVKMHPSYNNVDDKESKDLIKSGIDDIISSTKNINNLVFTIQLIVNKVPINELDKFFVKSFTCDLVDYRNKQWAKEIPEYKEFIELNGKELDPYKLSSLLKKIEKEAQKHGHGDKKEVKNLYNDGTWSLQVPLSFNGERSIAFYGKKGEKQTPTEWCTRADINWYNKYAIKSPLYVIRNWETGKSYQISFEKDIVNFLDQNDEKGDEITKGDLLAIPDKLLEFIKWNGKSLKDYKDADKDADKKATGKKIIKGSSFKDGTNELAKARWGDNIKLRYNIIKNVWENFSNLKGSKDRLTDYMINNKITSRYTKHNGNWAAKYYFKNNPSYFILMRKISSINNFFNEYYFDSGSEIEPIDEIKFREAVGSAEQELLLKVAQDDIGTTKKNERLENKKNHHLNLANNLKENAGKVLEKHILNGLSEVMKRRMRNCKLKIKNFIINSYAGSFIPRSIVIDILDSQNKKAGEIEIFKNNNSNKLDYSVDCYEDDDSSVSIDEFATEEEVGEVINKIILNYSKEMIKNKTGSVLRNNAKIVDLKKKEIDDSNPYRKTYFEDYFPY